MNKFIQYIPKYYTWVTAGLPKMSETATSGDPEAQPKPQPTVVGVGASAGGLAALKILLTHVPADSGLAFVVVVHLLPDHESHLAELLQPNIPLLVEQVTDNALLEPNHVYVIPPNSNISAIDTHLRLSKMEERRQERAPIDYFFRTLASTHDGHAIAVILTGTGSDGTLGVKEIKANGGVVIVQDPSEAEYDAMPQSAIATGLVDLVLPVAEIPEAILRFDRTQPRIPVPSEGEDVPQDDRILLQKVFAQLRARTDRDFSRYKRSTVLRRVARRMQLNNEEDLQNYLERLRERPEEVHALADDLLITVTNFFRDPEVFSGLERVVVPRLFDKKGPQDSVRAWSVGCATGEEAYSIGMLLAEFAARREMPPDIQVFGSDLHARSLEKAREGFYPGDIDADVSPERLKRFFIRESGGYRIRKEIREMMLFAPHNLLGDPPFSHLDFISCRNLLIYLERDVQRDVIELFHYALNPEGTLLLGSAESVEATDLFRVEDKKLCLYRKRNVPVREPRLPVFPLSRTRLPGDGHVRAEHPAEPLAYGRLHHQLIVEQYAPPSLLLGPDNTIVHLSERAGRYLVHPGGEPTENVLKLVRQELRIELQASLKEARDKKQKFDSKPIPVHFNGDPHPVVIRIRPALEAEREGYVLVIFEEGEPQKASPAPETGSSDADRIRVAELENELNLSHQRLQSIIEEYETSQEEMKASSEEMQSTNEELRSTMEELETSKEELQSINEELQTVNQQNRHRVEELAQLSADLQNLLAASDMATLFLNRELRIFLFTPKLGDLFNVRLTDRGRPISDLTHRLGYPDLLKDAEGVLERLVPVEREVQDDAGHWYLARVSPYRSGEDHIEGVVITFIDIHSRKKAEEALRASEQRLRGMINVEAIGVLIFDTSGALIDSNGTFLKMSGYSREEIGSKKLNWRGLTPPEHIPVSEQQWKKLAETGRIGPYEKEYFRKDGTRYWMIFAGASLGDGTVVEYCMDVSDRKQIEQQVIAGERNLRVTNDALVRANTDLKNFSYAVSHDMQEPLRMVMSFTQLLAREYRGKLDAQAGQYIEHAVEGARRMEMLLNDLREYWSVDEQKVEELIPIDCNQVLVRTLQYLETAIKESGASVTHDPLPTVPAELYPLTLLFQNLICNAIKYHRADTPPRIHVSAERNEHIWRFSVTDNGIGIDGKHLDAIFAPFKRLNIADIPGSGLGLAMCKKIVERYQGRIWVESKVGAGSKFLFTLPSLEGAK